MAALPDTWPAEYLPPLEARLKTTQGFTREATVRTVTLFCTWFEQAFPSRPVRLDIARLQAFRTHLSHIYSAAVVRRHISTLCALAAAGPDKGLRDWALDNGRELRPVAEILRQPWWSEDLRCLAMELEGTIGEARRTILEVDGYLRLIDRVGALPPDPVPHLFLAEGISERTRYQRLSRLCQGLELLMPGHPDLALLRAAQTALYPRVWPSAPQPAPATRRVPKVEALLAAGIYRKTAAPWAPSTVAGRRRALLLLHDILAAQGRALAFDKPSLDLYANHVKAQLALRKRTAGEKKCQGWCLRTATAMCERLLPFIPDPDERRRWGQFARRFNQDACQKGDPKRKERALAERPMTLEDYFRLAVALVALANDTTHVQRRHGILTTVGALGILLAYPLRRADLLRLVVGEHLVRDRRGWLLQLGQTQKTGTPVRFLRLIEEVTRFLDACLLRGTQPEALWTVYRDRCGTPFLASTKTPEQVYSADAFSDVVRRHTGHGPHILRTVWTDRLVERGADRLTIAAMLQHRDPLSQEAYEAIAKKVRLRQVLQIHAELIDGVLAA